MGCGVIPEIRWSAMSATALWPRSWQQVRVRGLITGWSDWVVVERLDEPNFREKKAETGPGTGAGGLR
jgi:hypothetical protein